MGADLGDDLEDVAARLGDQRRVGGDAVDHAEWRAARAISPTRRCPRRSNLGFAPSELARRHKGLARARPRSYLEAVAECIGSSAAGRRSCSCPRSRCRSAFLDRVEARFGARPGAWHSRRDPGGERRRLWMRWRRAVRGWSSARARRCSCPSRDLGLVVVDEEHEPAPTSRRTASLYNARDMAVLRASIEGARGGARLGDARRSRPG
jgi:hypothetical protein